MWKPARCSSEHLVIGHVFLVIALLACLAPAQSDTWWHLRSGQDIWQNGTIALYDRYSHTAAGAFWPNHEWLTELIFYGAYALGGMPLLAALCATAVTVAWAISWRLAGGSFEVRVLLFAFAIASAATHWALRPQVFSMALLATTVALLAAGRYRWLPVLFAVWTNLHGAVALGLVAVIAALAAAVVTTRTWPRSLTFTAAGCALATLVSPLGFRLWPEIVRSLERSRISNLIEWRPPDSSPALWPFWGLAVALPIMAALRRRHIDQRSATLTAIALVLLPLAVRSFRNVSVFVLVAAPAVATLTGLGPQPRSVRAAPRENDRVNAGVLAAAAVVVGTIVTMVWRAPAPSLGWRPISPDAVEAVEACSGPLYNTYEGGGFLIWFVPQKPVFVDNRQDPYPPEFLRAIHQLERDGQYDALFTRYRVGCAVVAPGSPVAQRLGDDSAWSLRHADERWMVFERGVAAGL